MEDSWLLIYATRPDHAVLSKKVHAFDWPRFQRPEFTEVWLE